MDEERRRFERIPLNTVINCRVSSPAQNVHRDEAPFTSRSIDISLGGLQMENNKPIQPDTPLVLLFSREEPQAMLYEVRSRVVWCRQIIKTQKYRIGLEFL